MSIKRSVFLLGLFSLPLHSWAQAYSGLAGIGDAILLLICAVLFLAFHAAWIGLVLTSLSAGKTFSPKRRNLAIVFFVSALLIDFQMQLTARFLKQELSEPERVVYRLNDKQLFMLAGSLETCSGTLYFVDADKKIKTLVTPNYTASYSELILSNQDSSLIVIPTDLGSNPAPFKWSKDGVTFKDLYWGQDFYRNTQYYRELILASVVDEKLFVFTRQYELGTDALFVSNSGSELMLASKVQLKMFMDLKVAETKVECGSQTNRTSLNSVIDLLLKIPQPLSFLHVLSRELFS